MFRHLKKPNKRNRYILPFLAGHKVGMCLRKKMHLALGATLRWAPEGGGVAGRVRMSSKGPADSVPALETLKV